MDLRWRSRWLGCLSAAGVASIVLLPLPACREEALPVVIESEAELRFPPGSPRPLRFYTEVLRGSDGVLYLGALKGGIYPSDHASLYAFRSDGSFVASLSASPAWPEAKPRIKLAGWDGDVIVATSEGLVDDERGATFANYWLSPDLRVLRVEAPAIRGILTKNGEYVAAIPREDESGEALCVQVMDRHGDFLRAFGRCPEGWRKSFVQQQALAVADDMVYWIHFREPILHVATMGGVELAAIALDPKDYLSLDAADARLGKDADIRTRLETATLVYGVIVVGNHVMVSFRVRNPKRTEYWQFDCSVVVVDITRREVIARFRVPWTLLGASADGHVYWMKTTGDTRDAIRHVLLRTRLEVPVRLAP